VDPVLENLVVPGIEPGPGTLATTPQRRSTFFYITYINSVRTSQETIRLRFVARNSDHKITEAVYFLLHNIYKFSSYLTGNNTSPLCIQKL
jgi:hypothetical protein